MSAHNGFHYWSGDRRPARPSATLMPNNYRSPSHAEESICKASDTSVECDLSLLSPGVS